MSSQKLLTNRTVLHLFKSSLNGRGPHICQICGLASCLRENPLTSILHHQQKRLSLSASTSSADSASGVASSSAVRASSLSNNNRNVMQKRAFVTTTINNNNLPDDQHVIGIRPTGVNGTSTRRFTTSASTSTFINNNKHQQQFRLSSTTSATNQLATEILAKREASTQARQQVKESPIYRTNNQESFRFSELEINECLPSERVPKPSVDELVFGKYYTDHMFRVDWDEDNGWSTPVISKVHDFKLHPAAKVLHYGLCAFEGAKAYRGHDDKIRFFRLDQNVERLLKSTRRLALPDFDVDEMIKCIHKHVELDQDWIPKSKPDQLTSLYLRPTIIGTDPSLGVACSNKATLYVLLSPVGPYFKTGFKPVSLYADPAVVRAWPGGAGNSKLGSNYAPTISPQRQAEDLGHQQVLWLFGDDLKLTEVGTMNIFVTYRNDETGKTHLVTPPLDDGLILPGITRDSILQMASQWDDIICEERYLTIKDIEQYLANGQLQEMFGSGTACIVCPINSIHVKDGPKIEIPSHNLNQTTSKHAITQRILNAITDIQYGNIRHPWAQELRHF